LMDALHLWYLEIDNPFFEPCAGFRRGSRVFGQIAPCGAASEWAKGEGKPASTRSMRRAGCAWCARRARWTRRARTTKAVRPRHVREAVAQVLFHAIMHGALDIVCVVADFFLHALYLFL